MATAALSSSSLAEGTNDDDLNTTQKFEKWLIGKLGGSADDELMFSNYLVSIISDEESTQEDKLESIKPLLQELNQNGDKFDDEDKFSQELIDKWNQMKLDDSASNDNKKSTKQTGETPTDTILSMINKHKTQIDTKKHATPASESCDYAADYVYSSDEDDETGEGTDKNKLNEIGENTNAKDAKEKERLVREKLAETHMKQKEQSKKALIEQREKELEKKKQKQAKAAKVERKR